MIGIQNLAHLSLDELGGGMSNSQHWGKMLCAALQLGLTPEAFWALSVREWQTLTAENGVGAAFLSDDLQGLMNSFPDGGDDDKHKDR